VLNASPPQSAFKIGLARAIPHSTAASMSPRCLHMSHSAVLQLRNKPVWIEVSSRDAKINFARDEREIDLESRNVERYCRYGQHAAVAVIPGLCCID